MSALTRRSFVKRSSAVSLGSILGLGLLPSLTRKLYAVDDSTLNGVKFSWEQTEISQKKPYGVGQLELKVSINPLGITMGACYTGGTVRVLRSATYTESHMEGTEEIIDWSAHVWDQSNYTWQCVEGVPRVVYMNNTRDAYDGIRSTTDPSQVKGLLYGEIHTLNDNDPSYEAKAGYVDETGFLTEWMPWELLGPLNYTVLCCAR